MHIMGSLKGACNCKDLSPRDGLTPWHTSAFEDLKLGDNSLEFPRGKHVKFTKRLNGVNNRPRSLRTSIKL